jgi:hypothetical protein
MIIILQVSVQSLRIYKNYFIETSETSPALYSQLQQAFVVVQSIYTFFSNTYIMVAYSITYRRLSLHYHSLRLQYYPKHLSDEDVWVMRRELLSLLLFIVSVCQIYVLRDVREGLFAAGF